MAKFSFKRPRIISKKFPGMDSTIDGVTKSLNELVFSYTDKVDKSLQKKHVMMAMSSLVFLLVLGSFISPKGKAESSVFYPETCLGGWVNPQYAEGEQETTSNGDESQFSKNNSAVLPKNTDAEMYCGNFKGKFDSATLPTKIIISLALTKGTDLMLENTVESISLASSSSKVFDVASTTNSVPVLSSSTAPSILTESSSTLTGGTTTLINNASETTSYSSATSSAATPTQVITPSSEIPSILNGVIESVKDTIKTIFDTHSNTSSGTTDTVVVPQSAPVEQIKAPVVQPSEPVNNPPTSYAPTLQEAFLSSLFIKVFAQETSSTTQHLQEGNVGGSSSISVESEGNIKAVVQISPKRTSSQEEGLKQSNASVATSTPEVLTTISSSSLPIATIIDASTTASSETVATTTQANQFQNNFLEVFYTFDGVTWKSLGELNEISMKYRTFEIPVTASTSWNDMTKLQIKIVAKKHLNETPTIYLDAIKVEVLYETPTSLTHVHPDFARDTFLKDTIKDSLHVVNIINNDSTHKEIWYKGESASSTINITSDRWSKIDFDKQGALYTLLYIHDSTIFFVDSLKNMLWAYNVTKDTHTGSPITSGATTSVSFFTHTNEEWAFEYNSMGDSAFARITKVIPEVHTIQLDAVVGDTFAKKMTQKEEEMIEITIPQEESYHMYTSMGVPVQYSSLSKGRFIMNARDIHLGSYVVVLTTREDGCEILTLDECKKDLGYTGELTITIGALPSPLATSTDVVIE